MIWSLFKHAVYAAVDERNKETRQLRALESIARSLDELAENGAIARDGYPMPSPSKGK